ncbi:MAG: BREX-1 system adenine-specific DNA-methyltransferase PglX [Acidobacteriota bacterium]
MDQALRYKLRNVVTHCHKLLEQAISDALQGQYGIHASGEIEDAARMTHLPAREQEYRERIVIHLKHILSSGLKPKDAASQLVREAAFTHLNRLCAYKMMATRGLIRDPVGKILKSRGFLFYLADHPEDERLWSGGQQETAYRHYLEWLNSTLSEEIGVLFSPHDVASGLFPPHRVLVSVIESLNSEELQSVWNEDETIGWVYQYFTPKELRDQARKESAAPRNSYEMAFRNQFFTPRYVVEFLVDNTLGRTWYEMRRGDTLLAEKCRYLVGGQLQKSGDSQSNDGQPTTDNGQRAKKDPREIKVLDPACGSGHFLLYCFDLLQTIYEEAYTDPELGPELQRDFPDTETFKREIPGLILAHNLHGIDIDLRVTQLAALALWLRAQRAFQEMGLKEDRPQIKRMNLVCAEPMSGEEDLLEEFISDLQPHVLGELIGELVRNVFKRMKLAGEAGTLVRIEDDISGPIEEARRQWQEMLRRQAEGEEEMARKGALFDYRKEEAQQKFIFDIADITSEKVWQDAEAQALESLREYARRANNGKGLARRLFADDTEQGFAFIDLCRRKFDVVLMNPPFGDASKPSKTYIELTYPRTKNDVYAAFVERGLNWLQGDGMLGAITSRTGFFLSSFQKWREEILLKESRPLVFADLGYGVLDTAMVETATYVLSKPINREETVFIRLLTYEDKAEALAEAVDSLREGRALKGIVHRVDPESFRLVMASPFVYWVPVKTLERLVHHDSFEPAAGEARQGLVTGDNPQFVRTIWEVPVTSLVGGNNIAIAAKRSLSELRREIQTQLASGRRWVFHVMAGASQPWFSPLTVVVDWENDGERIKNFKDAYGKLRSRPQGIDYYFRPGFSWTLRAFRLTPYAIPAGCIHSASRYMAFPKPGNEALALAVVASNLATAYARFYGEKFEWPKFLVETIKRIPWTESLNDLKSFANSFVSQEVEQRRAIYRNHEPFQEFTVPALIHSWTAGEEIAWNAASLLGEENEQQVASSYGLSEADMSILNSDLFEAIQCRTSVPENSGEEGEGDGTEDQDFVLEIDIRSKYAALLSYILGCVFGRWDVRMALDLTLAPKLPDTFDPVPLCPIGMLVGPDGLPAASGRIVSTEWLRNRPDANTLPPENSFEQATTPDTEYPISIDWDGILVDDPDHEDDIIRRLRDVFELVFKDRAEEIEREACELLGVKTLRDYFRKPAAGGFWADHIKRYSKSRRKAPIYWLLQSSKKSYAIWLYYHRLDRDILFKALINYVEPKMRLEETRLEQSRSGRAEGATGREARELDRRIEKQEALLSELRDFHDRVRRAAELRLEPDLNDGVVLNIAPLWEVAPWAEAKKYWQELLAGKYEWSTVI